MAPNPLFVFQRRGWLVLLASPLRPRRRGHRPHQFLLKLFTQTTAQAQAALHRKGLDGKARPP
ncbi:MAG: hypothetical protein NTW03_21080 [Verrucomicrobia bacterium]|nr:hypothetical protein [Verrucomicrobiota bacterium]